jgi:hypothetical protein
MKFLRSLIRPLIIVIVAGIVIGIIVWSAIAIIVSPSRGETFIDVIQTFISPWPFAILVLVLILLKKYPAEIRELLGRWEEGAGFKFSPPSAESIEEDKRVVDNIEKLRKEKEELSQKVIGLEESVSTQGIEREGIIKGFQESLNSLWKISNHWRFKYYNTFFDKAMRGIFMELCEKEKGSGYLLEGYYEYWKYAVMNLFVLDKILKLFISFELIMINNSRIFVTSLGRDFLEHMKKHPLPYKDNLTPPSSK